MISPLTLKSYIELMTDPILEMTHAVTRGVAWG
jgi:hypothetical protein